MAVSYTHLDVYKRQHYSFGNSYDHVAKARNSYGEGHFIEGANIYISYFSVYKIPSILINSIKKFGHANIGKQQCNFAGL